MLLTHLEGLLAAAEERSISRAADRLYLSQPALTSRIQALERELGVPLLVRNGRGVELTEIGKAFLPYARRALEAVEDGQQLTQQLRDGLAGTLTIAAARALSTYVLPPLLKRFRTAHPGIHIAVRTGHPDDVVSLVLRDEVHLGLVCELTHPELVTTELMDDELVLVAAPELAATLPRRLRLESLAALQIVVFSASSYDAVVDALLRDANVPRGNVMELDSIDATKSMVENGIGIAFLPRVAIADALDDGRLVPLEIRGVPAMPRHIVALRRRDAGPPNGPAAHFLALAVSHPNLPRRPGGRSEDNAVSQPPSPRRRVGDRQ